MMSNKKLPWTVCLVPDARSMYTFGLPQLFGHPNFMICDSDITTSETYQNAYYVELNKLAGRVAEGHIFHDGDLDTIADGKILVKFNLRVYGKNDTPYLLITICDEDGEFGLIESSSIAIFEEESSILKNNTKASSDEVKAIFNKMYQDIRNKIN